MLPKVVLIGTGGTIASRYDPAARPHGRLAARRGPARPGAAARRGRRRSRSTTSRPSRASTCRSSSPIALAERINQQLARDDVAGVVVTHGTDTMEESCYLADLLLQSDKPAVFTGAQRAHDDPNPDGPGNLLARCAPPPRPRRAGSAR